MRIILLIFVSLYVIQLLWDIHLENNIMAKVKHKASGGYLYKMLKLAEYIVGVMLVVEAILEWS
jgi:hypothetical protein